MNRLKLDRDVVFLDLEATGVDVARDRIVQVALVRLSTSGERSSYDSLIDPETKIPLEAIEVHHITDEMVRGAPRFRDVAPKLLKLLDGADIGGFGVTRYDIPMLTAEFKRCGLAFSAAGRRVLDALTIFHRMESRNLSAAYEFYCGKKLEGAHSAIADATASLEVLLAQVERYRGQDGKPALPADSQGVHNFCAACDSKHVDSRGKFVWRHGVATFNFGKYQTRPLEDIVRIDRSYVEWLASGESASPEVAEICRCALAGQYPVRTPAPSPAKIGRPN